MSLINQTYLKLSASLIKEIERSQTHPFEYQRNWFEQLIQSGKETVFGQEHHFGSIHSTKLGYAMPGGHAPQPLTDKNTNKSDSHLNHAFPEYYKNLKKFQNQVPIRDYNAFVPYITRLRKGENNVLWNQPVKWFAKSSGTSSDQSKFIPITPDSLKINHYGGFKRMLAWYVAQHPKSNLFKGKALTLGGSVQIDEMGNGNCFYGDLSAILLKNSPAIVEAVRTPKRATALISDFNKKIEQICIESHRQNVTNFSGVPSWNLILLNKILEYTGKKTITDAWPNMELFMHGGIGFEPYREIYRAIIPGDNMHYLENYNASEGYFSFQDDLTIPSMLLTVNNGIFYEFIPMSIFDKVVSGQVKEIPTLEDVTTGVDYAVVISTCGGLWRYLIGDCIRFTSLFPHRIQITGRTQLYINAFGEELMISNAEKALSEACRACHCSITDFTVAPVFMKLNAPAPSVTKTESDPGLNGAFCPSPQNSITTKGYHQWAIEFSKPPQDMQEFAKILDNALTLQNSDYQAKRQNNATMEPLQIINLKPGTFFKWMDGKNKLGGQNKVPRLYGNSKFIDELIAI